jgi:hypothetical protein
VDESGTAVTCRVTECDAPRLLGYGYGWEDFLDRLGTLLTGGDPDSVSWAESQETLAPLWAALA